LLSVKRRTSSPVVTEQVEKACEAAAPAQPTKTFSGLRGRPKGSKHRHRREVAVRPSLRFLQEHIQRLLQQVGDAFKVRYCIVTVSWVRTMLCTGSEAWVCIGCHICGRMR